MTLLNGSLSEGTGGGGGGAKRNTRTVSVSSSVLGSDEIIYVDATAAPVVMTFIPNADNADQQVEIVKIDLSANTVSIYDGVDTVGELTTPAVGRFFASYAVQSHGDQLFLT